MWQSHPLFCQLRSLLLVANAEDAGSVDGAGPVLIKPIRLEELDALLVACDKCYEVDQSISAEMLQSFGLKDASVFCPTPTERQLWDFLARNQGRFFSTRDLLRQVWGYPDGAGGQETVRVHVSNLRRKLRQIDSALAEIIQTAHGWGYRMILDKVSINES